MKRILAMLAALILLLSGLSLAESGEQPTERAFETLGQARKEAEFDGVAGGTEERWYAVVRQGDKIIRLVIPLDEKANALYDAIFTADDYDTARAEYNDYLDTLPVLYTEEMTAQPLDQAALDGLVGKTLSEIEEEGYQMEEIGTHEDGYVTSIYSYGLFSYSLDINESIETYMDYSEHDRTGELTVKSARLEGISHNAADPHYRADGTMEPQEDPMAEFNTLMEAVMEAMQGATKEDGTIDTDAVIQKLVELMPEHEAEIRQMVPYLSLLNESVKAPAQEETVNQ